MKLEPSLLSAPQGALFLWGLLQVCHNDFFHCDWMTGLGVNCYHPWPWQTSQCKVSALGLLLLSSDQARSPCGGLAITGFMQMSPNTYTYSTYTGQIQGLSLSCHVIVQAAANMDPIINPVHDDSALPS